VDQTIAQAGAHRDPCREGTVEDTEPCRAP
jgi:hypothetical protein